MKRIIKYISISLLVVFSFYYTNLVSKIFINNSPLMVSIINEQQNYEEKYINAQINDLYIIPGINGIEIDKLNSYYVMKKNDSFNKDLLVLKEIKPKDSYYDHMELIINKGNYIKNSISIIVQDNNEIINYLLDHKIAFSRMVDINTIKEKASYQQINNDFLHYEQVDKILDNNNINTNICIINKENIDTCRNYGKYLIEPTYILNNNDYSINNLSSGDIIMIGNSFSLTKLKLLLKRSSFLNLKIVYLDYLVSENR